MGDIAIELAKNITDINLDFIAKLIGILCGAVGVGVGVIIFTLILKTVVLPFDIYQRVITRKQSLKMESMRPELEKLQKQYANDKNMYSQKMMELYKKNNYSPLKACLPALATMVILIVAFMKLNSYSQYENLHTYKNMVTVFNAQLFDGMEEEEYFSGATSSEVILGEQKYMRYASTDENKYIVYLVSVNAEGEESKERYYHIDGDRAYAALNKDGAIDEYITAQREGMESPESYTMADGVKDYVYHLGSKAAAEYFRSEENDNSFFWIKNLWYADTSFAHPIETYSNFTSKITEKIVLEDGTKVQIKDVISENTYNLITSELNEEKTASNGYYILVVLSIGLMLLSQILSMKSQKAQNDLQSVDGAGKGMQKGMMIIMPIIFGIFAFQYSGAFSIYMVISSLYSIITMLVSQFFVDRWFNKKQKEAELSKYTRKNFNKKDK